MTLTADQLRGRVCVLIDGEEKCLRFDQGALARLIDELGIEGLSGVPGAVMTLDADTLSALVWAGRLWELPELTRDQVRDWFYPMMPTYNAAIEGINLALWGQPVPDLDDGGSDDDTDPPNGQIGTSDPLNGSRSSDLDSIATSSGEPHPQS